MARNRWHSFCCSGAHQMTHENPPEGIIFSASRTDNRHRFLPLSKDGQLRECKQGKSANLSCNFGIKDGSRGLAGRSMRGSLGLGCGFAEPLGARWACDLEPRRVRIEGFLVRPTRSAR